MANIGFIGLGIMGAPMAGHLINGGYTVYTFTHGEMPKASPPACPQARSWST